MRNSISLLFISVLLLFSQPAHVGAAQPNDAEGGTDHVLAPRMSNFYLDRYEENEFDHVVFKTESGTVEVEGRKFVIDYRIQTDVTSPEEQDILLNYQDHFKSIRADLLLQGAYYDVFKVTQNGTETWIKVDPGTYDGSRYTLTIVEKKKLPQSVSTNGIQLSDPRDVAGSKDHPLVSRMSNFFISGYKEKESDSEALRTENETVEVAGRKFIIDYRLSKEAIPPGKAQIMQNYQNALLESGADLLFQGPYYSVLRIVEDGGETWVKVDPGVYDGKRYTLTIVESNEVSEVPVLRSKSQRVITTDTLEMTGLSSEDRIIRTAALQMTGLSAEDRVIRTDTLQMTGLDPKDRIIQTDTLEMTGFND